MSDRCELCGRPVGKLDRHHLIPRCEHGSRPMRRAFDRQEMHERVAMLCRPCHKTVHATLDEKQLAREYNTIEGLRSHPEIARFVAWVRKQDPGKPIQVHRPASRRRK
jgi:5-methylcytosine-specific restriction endonuclease McrA